MQYENDRWFRVLVENSWDLMTLMEADGTLRYVNPAASRILGYDAEELVGRGGLDLIHEEDLPTVADVFERLLAEPGTTATVEYRARHRDGTWRWMEGTGTNLLQTPGVEAIVTHSRDITDRRRAEEALRESEEAERGFAEQLTGLHEISNELSKAESFDALCRRAVELGRGRLGFDRLGIWFVGKDRATAMGSFGVDERGQLRDERGSRVTVTPQSVAGQVLASGMPFVVRGDSSVRDHRGEVVGRGSHAIAALWDGKEVIGFISTDNLLRHEPITERQCRLLALYASTLGHLCSLKRLEEEIRQRVEALAEVDRRKDEFLAMLGHELRNPLGAISNSLYVMELPQASDAARQRALSVLKRQVGHQVRLVDDLLDVSRITRGRVELRTERLDLARLVREGAEDHRVAMQEGGLSLLLDAPDEPVWVEGDATRLSQVLSNLLSNAMKFTDRGGRVTVRLTVEGQGSRVKGQGSRVKGQEGRHAEASTLEPRASTLDRAVLTVRDTGMGISPELLGDVFETFFQGDRSLDRSRGGLGLGLALVKGLIQLHGGEVRADSDGPGRGASFTFSLPLALPAESRREVEEVPEGGHAIQARRVRILVVEDNRDAASTLREMLELSGYTVEIAYSGPAAIEHARHFRPDVVLCDIGLPGMDGYDVAVALRRDPRTVDARLIAVTGYGQDEDRRRSREAGFDYHLVKPVDVGELQRLLA